MSRRYSAAAKRELADRMQARMNAWKFAGGRVAQVEPGNSMLDELRVTAWFRSDPVNVQTFTVDCVILEQEPDLLFELVRQKLPVAGGFFERLKGDRQR